MIKRLGFGNLFKNLNKILPEKALAFNYQELLLEPQTPQYLILPRNLHQMLNLQSQISLQMKNKDPQAFVKSNITKWLSKWLTCEIKSN
jgi:hypothetical protein